MMAYSVELHSSAAKELEKLPNQVQANVIKHLRKLSADPRPTGCKKIADTEDCYRIRIGDYRAIYAIFDSRLTVLVLGIAARDTIYKQYGVAWLDKTAKKYKEG